MTCTRIALTIVSFVLRLGVALDTLQQGLLPICNLAPGGSGPASTCSLTITPSAGPMLQFLGRWELDKHTSFTIPFPRLMSTQGANVTALSLECVCSGGTDCSQLHLSTSLQIFPAAAQFGGVPPLLSTSLAPPVGQCSRSSCFVAVHNLPLGGLALSPGSAVLRFGPEPPAPAPVSTSPPYALCHSTWRLLSGSREAAEFKLTNKWTPKFDSSFCISTEKLALPGSSLVDWRCECHDMDCTQEMAATRLHIFSAAGLRRTSETGSEACAAESRSLTLMPLDKNCNARACNGQTSIGTEAASVGMQMCFSQTPLI